jgi:hypothetical protein
MPPKQLRVLALDIGISNMAHCIVAFPERGAARSERVAATEPLKLARALLGESTIVEWKRSSIGCSRGATTADLVDMALVYYRRNRSAFLGCDEAVIEQQPAARMRNIAVAIFALLRADGITARFQGASQKLAFGAQAMSAYLGESADARHYRSRKRLGEQLVRRLITEHDRHVDELRLFVCEKKRDDLADCLLHCLAHRCLEQRSALRRGLNLCDGCEHEPREGAAADGALDDERLVPTEVEL